MIKVGARTLKETSTRAGDNPYIAFGPVTEGEYTVGYQYYYSNINSGLGTRRLRYRYGEVEFGQPGAENTGFINISPTGIKELTWGSTGGLGNGIFMFGSGSTPANFFMDNVPITPSRRPYMNSASNTNYVELDSIVNLKGTLDDTATGNFGSYYPNKYNAGVLDSINGKNDLLWGTMTATHNQNPLSFELQHRMCRFNLAISVDNRGEEVGKYNIDLSHATVYITHLQLEPDQYWRDYGDLIFPTPPVYKDFYLVGEENLNPTSPGNDSYPYWNHVLRQKNIEDGGKRYYGEDIPNKFTGYETYYTQNFVIPDQSLEEGINWPQIVIKVPREDVNNGVGNDLPDGDYIEFSGGMPHGIRFVTYDDYGNRIEEPNVFRFWKGTNINLKVNINPEGWSLSFVPVVVLPWVDKGTFGPEAKQAGIHTAQDLYNLIDYWNADDFNEFNLKRYGYNNGDKWIIQFQAPNLEFDLEKIQGQMKVKDEYPFSFDFRGRREYLIIQGRENPSLLDRTAGQNTLYSIVTGDTNTGVSQSDFETLTNAYQAFNWQLGLFGEYNKNAKKWEFTLNENLVFDDITQVEGMMIPQSGTVDFSFNFNGHTVTVAGQSYTEQAFITLLSTRAAGIYYDTDFMALIEAYQAGNTTALQQFGVNNGGTWSFIIRRNNLTFDIEDIKGMMQLDQNNPINFSFNLLKYTVKVLNYDGSTSNLSEPTGADTLYKIVSGPKMTGLTSAQDMINMIIEYKNSNAANNYSLTQFGYYNTKYKLWHFYLDGEIQIDWSELFGMMPVEDDAITYIFNMGEFAVTVTGIPPTYSNDSTMVLVNETGGGILYKILSGTYETLTTPAPDEP